MSGDLPPLLSCYLGLLGIAEQLLAEGVDEEMLLPLADAEDGRQMLIVRRYGDQVVTTAADLLSQRAATLIAIGRTDVHRSLELALETIAARLRAHDDPELVRLGIAVDTAVHTVVQGVASAPDRGDRGG